MIFERRTLRNDVSIEGLGLHSGVPVRVTVHPGEQGIVFFGPDNERVEAVAENVTDTTRCTRLGSISTIEHIMSVFAGLEITDAEIEIDAAELPGLDGSAASYVTSFLGVGLDVIGEKEVPDLYRRVFHQEDATKIAVAKGTGHWRFVYDLGERWPNAQAFELSNVVHSYSTEIAPARTFALAEEVPHLIQVGLGRGLDIESALILGIEGYKNDARFPDEPARHKLLDLIGDLYLAGVPIRMLNVVAERSGHRTNVQVAAMLRSAVFGKAPTVDVL